MENNIEEFDKELTKIYSDIISLCLEYTESKVDIIYVLGVNVGNQARYSNVFFKKDEFIFRKHVINDYIDDQIDTPLQQKYLINTLNSDFKKIYILFEEYQSDIPTEIKLKYNTSTGKFASDISYDKRIEMSETFSVDDVFDEWMEQAENGNDGFNF